MWPLKSSALAAAGSREARDELRTPLEPHARARRAACPRSSDAVELEELDVSARRAEAARRGDAWSACSCARRVVGVPGGGVEADQRGGERDELVLAARDLGDDVLLGL